MEVGLAEMISFNIDFNVDTKLPTTSTTKKLSKNDSQRRRNVLLFWSKSMKKQCSDFRYFLARHFPKSDGMCRFFGQNQWKSDAVTFVAFWPDAIQKATDCVALLLFLRIFLIKATDSVAIFSFFLFSKEHTVRRFC